MPQHLSPVEPADFGSPDNQLYASSHLVQQHSRFQRALASADDSNFLSGEPFEFGMIRRVRSEFHGHAIERFGPMGKRSNAGGNNHASARKGHAVIQQQAKAPV